MQLEKSDRTLKKEEKEKFMEENLFTKEHCRPIPNRTLKGLVLTLNPEVLVEADRKEKNQLYMCIDSEIYPPDYSKHPVLVTCLGDGENYSWNLEDFVGVLEEEHVPDWAEDVGQTLSKPMTSLEKQYHQSEPPPFPMPFDCRVLAQYGDIMLMARKKENSTDYMTYRLDHDKNGVSHGHYYDMLNEAQKDFAVRSGLVSSSDIFSLEEKLAMGEACEYALDYGDLLANTEEYVQDVLNKIDYDFLVANQENVEDEYDR